MKCVYYKPLTELDLSSLSEVEVCSIIKHLQHYSTTLVKLKLHDTVIAADTAQSLLGILQVNRSLTHLNLANLKNFSEFGAYCVFKGLQHNTTLVKLNLINCDITVTYLDTARLLSTMLRENNSLTHLNISGNYKFSDLGAQCIFGSFQHNSTLVKLNLSDCDIAVANLDTARLLSTMLRENKSLTHLNISGNYKFSDLGAQCIFESLQHNSTLVKLNLSNCDIAVANLDTARLLSTMLRENNSLTHLNISGNYKFSDLGAQCIFESLQHNSTLVYLNLSMTTITATDPDTARSLTEMLQVNKSLTHLDLSCTSTVPENCIISLIFSALEHNTTLLHLVLRGIRHISKYDAELIASALKSNQSLLTIDISCANIDRVDIILDALKINTTLKKMCITYDWVADVAVGDLQKARKERRLPPIDIEFIEKLCDDHLFLRVYR